MRKTTVFICISVLLAHASMGEKIDFSKAVILFIERDQKWKVDIYDQIIGATHEEKAHNARSTWELKSIAEIELWKLEDKFYALSEKLYQTMESTEQELFIKTHTAWKSYVELQARLLAGDQGSLAPLYARYVIITEIEQRMLLYEEMLDGKNLYKTGFSMYE